MTDEQTLDDLPQPDSEGALDPGELDVDGDNPNEMSDETFGLLCERMRQNGWLGGPIVTDTDGLIADGEHRWRAAQEIALAEVPVRQYEIDDATRRLWRQELNKIHGEHDRKRDALEYDYLLDNGKSDEVTDLVEAAGEDLDELLAEIRVDTSRPAEYEYDPDHDVHFEDCVEGMRERLEDDSVDCVVTDPPYGIDIDGEHGKLSNDDEVSRAIELLDDCLGVLREKVKPDGHVYIHWTPREIPPAQEVIERHFALQNILVWKKNRSNVRATLELPRYAYNYEVVFFATPSDDARPLNGRPTSNIDVFEESIVPLDDLQHTTQKPVSLVERFLQNSTIEGDRVLDPFMGSGTTAVAAIQNDRDYVGFELDAENYRDVIERRIGEAKRAKDATVNQEAEADD